MSNADGIASHLGRARYLIVASIISYGVIIGGLFAVTGTPGNYKVNANSGFFNNLLNTIQSDVVSGFSNIINTIFGQFNTITKNTLGSVGNAITSFLNLIVAIPNGLVNVVQKITSGVTKTIGQIFNFGLTGQLQFHAVLIGGAQVPYLAIIFTSVLLVGIGLSVIQFGDQLASVIPITFIGTGFVTTFGEIFIILGAAFAVYGSFPNKATIIFGLAFGAIGIVALLQVIGIVRGVGGGGNRAGA